MSDKAEEIRRQMLHVRTAIDEDVDELVDAAKTLVDWKEYVRSAPWATAGLACAIGFMVVPGKKRALAIDGALKQSGDFRPGVALVSAKKPSLFRIVAGKLAATTMQLAFGEIAKHASVLLAGNKPGNSGESPFSRQSSDVESYESTY